MESYYPQSLLDLCGIRIAYFMWTRQDVYRNVTFTGYIFDQQSHNLLRDVRKLALPERCEFRILEHVDFSGRQLIPLLYLWMSKTKLKDSQVNFLKNMLYGNLVLDSDGLLNPRETAAKLLDRRRLPTGFAFRLACVNFLGEVFKLWIDERQYFLNRITLQEETEEVLFWIYYCLSKEDTTSILNISVQDLFYESCTKYSIDTGNTALLDISKDGGTGNTIKFIFTLARDFSEIIYHQKSVIYDLKRLNLNVKAELFREYSNEMVHLYLNWPLSQTFVEKAEEIWKLIPDEYKDRVFVKIFKYLYGKDEDEMYEYDFMPIPRTIGNYRSEYLVHIWDCLWKISLESHKLAVLNEFVFRSIEKFAVRKIYYTEFDTSFLKKNMLKLFLSNGKTVFELYRGQNLKESLMKFIAKHLPQDFKELNHNFFKETPKKRTIKWPDLYSVFIPSRSYYPVNEDILRCIKEILPSNRD